MTLCSAEIVRWVAESKRPFEIVNDRGFQSLMKTGRPGYHIPSADTVSRDTKQVFVQARKRIAKMLQVLPFNFMFRQRAKYYSPGIRRSSEFCYRCLDIAKPQGICCCYSSFRV